ncbi:unnamed protein product [Orchesella dallaii]|uniref:Cell wall hydrolase SleB domain-containing protein n=1 Tax=Orchesella dallaii TaxID=48710 RepID=A0ABP1QQP1_9HEXA
MSSYDHEILSKTIYAEARGEPLEGQRWVGHVIMNRAEMRGMSIADVCLQPSQFECWNNRDDIKIKDRHSYSVAKEVASEVMNRRRDPTGGCDHYNNPDKEGYPGWTRRVTFVRKIGNHNFYKE